MIFGPAELMKEMAIKGFVMIAGGLEEKTMGVMRSVCEYAWCPRVTSRKGPQTLGMRCNPNTRTRYLIS